MEKLDLRLASNPDWWERNENYAKVLKPNAPKEAQDSYQHFLEQCKYYDKIYGKVSGITVKQAIAYFNRGIDK